MTYRMSLTPYEPASATRTAAPISRSCDCSDHPAEVERDCCCVGGDVCRIDTTEETA